MSAGDGVLTSSFATRWRDRALTPASASRSIGLGLSDPYHLAFPLGFVAVLLLFALPASLLTFYGLYSETAADSPLTKFHPATYFAILGALFALYGRRNGGGVTWLLKERPALAWSLILILFCAAYSIISVGTSGVAVFVETFLSAVFLAIALGTGTPRQRRLLGYTILAFCVFNVLMSAFEDTIETHFLPVSVGLTQDYDKGLNEFRGQALYTHPLTGALVTSLALFMVLGTRLSGWLKALLFAAFIVGLLSFGGRSALVTTLFMITCAALFQLGLGLATRHLPVGFLVAFVAGTLFLPVLFALITTTTDLGARIFSHLYLDNSADERIIQWHVLPLLNLRQVLLGVTMDGVQHLKMQVGLTGAGADIENPWLLLFLNLGAVGFPLIIAGIFLLLLQLGQQANSPLGWLIITATILICSTNNSLGRKAPDLMFLTGIMISLSGFREGEEAVTSARPATVFLDPTANLVQASSVRLRSLTAKPSGQEIRLRSLQ
ncbi:MAG TPA: VpsF family polysaccharide biosynthesis protein [Acetobacteraceae bacterium]|nr:VpsF family polysaccharide biosynthesis protein [Acetobacteraceae bacterium]